MCTQVNITQLQAVVNTLVSCIVLPSPGMSCAAVTSLMTPGYTQIDGVRSYAASHYIGVLRVMHPDHQNPFLKADMYRFIWNYLAVGTSAGSPGDPCGVNSNKCPAGQVSSQLVLLVLCRTCCKVARLEMHMCSSRCSKNGVICGSCKLSIGLCIKLCNRCIDHMMFLVL